MDKSDLEPAAPVLPVTEDPKPSAYAWYVASVLTLTYILSFIDRKLPFILVESIKHDLNLSDTQIGLLNGVVFTLVYAVAAIPIPETSGAMMRTLKNADMKPVNASTPMPVSRL